MPTKQSAAGPTHGSRWHVATAERDHGTEHALARHELVELDSRDGSDVAKAG